MTFRLMVALFLMTALSRAQPFNPPALVGPGLAEVFNFEGKHVSLVPEGWQAQAGGVSLDRFGAHEGKWGVRLDSDTKRPGLITHLNKTLLVDFTGQQIEFRAFLKTEAVTESATLSMALLDADQKELSRYVMLGGDRKGTTPWQEGIVRMPLLPGAAAVRLWIFAKGGTTWVDDIRLLVDGKPVWEAPKIAAVTHAP